MPKLPRSRSRPRPRRNSSSTNTRRPASQVVMMLSTDAPHGPTYTCPRLETPRRPARTVHPRPEPLGWWRRASAPPAARASRERHPQETGGLGACPQRAIGVFSERADLLGETGHAPFVDPAAVHPPVGREPIEEPDPDAMWIDLRLFRSGRAEGAIPRLAGWLASVPLDANRPSVDATTSTAAAARRRHRRTRRTPSTGWRCPQRLDVSREGPGQRARDTATPLCRGDVRRPW